MDQEIRFCTTKDGVSIAYSALGAGPPLVYVTGWPGHLALEWERPFLREFLQTFASAFTFVRYDMRSTGLSGPADNLSLEALVKDLEAVIDHLSLDNVALLSLGLLAGPIAMTYAAAHAERVSKMVLLGPFLKGDRLMTDEQYRALSAYVAAFGQIITPDDFRDPERHGLDPERIDQAAAIHEASSSPPLLAQLLEALYRTDLTDIVRQLDVPALVLHGSGDNRIRLDVAREAAASLPNARFFPYDGAGGAAWADSHIILPEIFAFLGAPPPDIAPRVAPRPTGSMSTILFTDIESSTARTQRLGDARAQELLRQHNAIVREAVRANGGSEIKHTGDGIMASFPTASSALQAAVAIQRAVGERDDPDLAVHVGLNAGEPVAEDEDLFGIAVQLARRICDHADAGQIMVSNVVRELAAGKSFLFAETGEAALKGFEEPVRLYEVRWRDEGG